MLKGYDYVVLGEGEFHGVELAKWLQSENVAFALPQKADTYIQPKGQKFQQLNQARIIPGNETYIPQVEEKSYGIFEA